VEHREVLRRVQSGPQVHCDTNAPRTQRVSTRLTASSLYSQRAAGTPTTRWRRADAPPSSDAGRWNASTVLSLKYVVSNAALDSMSQMICTHGTSHQSIVNAHDYVRRRR
jgi:hypothetical protein